MNAMDKKLPFVDAHRFNETISGFVMFLKASGHASSTVDCYSRSLYWFVEMFGNIPIRHVQPCHLEQLIVHLSRPSETGIERCASTMNRIKSAYRSFFKWAFETGLTPLNPATRLVMTSVQSQPTQPITKSEINRFLRTIRQSGDKQSLRDETLFAIYAFTGIRRFEALHLRIKDYDPSSFTLQLNKTKGGSKRLQPIPPLLAGIMDKYLCAAHKEKAVAHSPLFASRYSGAPLSTRQASARFDLWKRLSDIRRELTIHSFRAGFATILYRHTSDILLVSRALGHRDIRTTKRYIQDDFSTLETAIKRSFK